EQVKAIQNLKIDKITVWDSGGSNGNNGGGTTAGFLASLIGSLPAMHELAHQAGIELPEVLGRLDDNTNGASRLATTAPSDASRGPAPDRDGMTDNV
ncbi:MAG: hypothetical protein GY715_09560, partial [Planctomycetes bacterium]|nr:hypothetical protein [Planctomycetota bacterium]